ncbi:LysM peptidoglycan-binding domain-containing protein [bacterium]|nr:LysM peptidoglycan-binding domain-containing protein [bacterium]
MLKKLLSVVALASISCFATSAELRSDHPETYTVKRGDTLWDISSKFLKSPWNWPEIWQANPQVENPHLIYPGDVLSLVYIDGKPMLVPMSGPRIRRESIAESVKPIPLSAIQQFLDRPRLLTEAEWKSAPYVVGLEENRLRGMNTQLAYVRQLPAGDVGAKYAIARPTVVYRDVPAKYPWDKENKTRRADVWENETSRTLAGGFNWLWRDWLYEKNTRVLGYEVLEIGTAEVVEYGDPSTSYVRYVDQEIKAGDILLPINSKPFDLEFVPRPPKAVPANTRILAFTDAYNAAGSNQVVVISKGSEDGLENGQTFSVYTPGETIRDSVRYGRDSADLRLAFNRKKAMVKLPDEFVGHVMVFRTFEGVSYGLLLDGIKPVHLGDYLQMPVE